MFKRAWFNIKYSLLLAVCWLVGMLPTWFLYHVVLDVIYFFLYKVAGYRIKIVRDNLKRAFPEKSAEELAYIERRFYLQLAEIFIDSIDIISISRSALKKRMKFPDAESHEKEVEGRDWIGALAHYGTWEYFAAYQFYADSQTVGVYHYLHSEVFDKLYRYSRSRFGMELVSMHKTMRYIIDSRRQGKRISLGLIADQAPRASEHPNWFEFLGQKTNFYLGPEKIARKFNMPVYFVHTTKEGRARYSARFEMIYDGAEQVPDGEVTRRYAAKLEDMIREEPWLWMWSHRRWKKPKNAQFKS